MIPRFLDVLIVRRLGLMVAVLIGVFKLPGCTILELELNNRGGWVDSKLDSYWWTADTKPMRVLRAYALVGSVARMAQTTHKSDREAIIQRVNTAIAVASDAFYCAYSQPGRCVYFDERMAELEAAVLHLLSTVLISKEDDDLFKAVNQQLSKTFPLLKGVETLSGMVQVVTKSAEFASNASKVVSALFEVGEAAYFKGRRLGALYRDSLELQMIAVLTSLDTMCAIQQRQYVSYNPTKHEFRDALDLQGQKADRLWAIANFYGAPTELPPGACQAFAQGHRLWTRGAGELSSWKDYLDATMQLYRKHLIPTEDAFVQASDLIWRACEHITSDRDELSDCIGRRRLRNASNEQVRIVTECALDFDGNPAKALETAKQLKIVSGGDSRSRLFSEKEIGEWSNQCRLILYKKLIAIRAEPLQRDHSHTRIYWLSQLTPSPSFPLAAHPGQAQRALPPGTKLEQLK